MGILTNVLGSEREASAVVRGLCQVVTNQHIATRQQAVHLRVCVYNSQREESSAPVAEQCDVDSMTARLQWP